MNDKSEEFPTLLIQLAADYFFKNNIPAPYAAQVRKHTAASHKLKMIEKYLLSQIRLDFAGFVAH